MNTHETRELHSEFLDGTLSEEQNLRVEEHLEACTECRADLESLRKTVHLIASAPRERAPEGVLSSIMARVGSPQAAAPRPRRIRSLMPALQGLAALLVIGIFLQIAVQNRPPLEPTRRPGSDLAPRSFADRIKARDAEEVASRYIEEEGDVPARSLEEMRADARKKDLQEVVLLDNRGVFLLSRQGVLPSQEAYFDFEAHVEVGEDESAKFRRSSPSEGRGPKLTVGGKGWSNDKVSPFDQIRWMEAKFKSNERTQGIVAQAAHNNAIRFARSGGRAKGRGRGFKHEPKRKAFADKRPKDNDVSGIAKGGHRNRMVLQLKFYQRLEIVEGDRKGNRAKEKTDLGKKSADGDAGGKEVNAEKAESKGASKKMKAKLRPSLASGSGGLRQSLLKKFRGAILKMEAGRPVIVLPNLSPKRYKELREILNRRASVNIHTGRVGYRFLPVNSVGADKDRERASAKKSLKQPGESKAAEGRPAPAPSAKVDTITVTLVLPSVPREQPAAEGKKGAAKK